MEKYSRKDDMGKMMENMRGKYLGHALRKRESLIEVSLGCEPEEKRSPCKPKTKRRRVVLKRMKTAGMNGSNNKK